MSIESPEEFIEKNTKEIIKFYYQQSRLDNIATLIKNKNLYQSKKLGKRINIPRDALFTNVDIVWSKIIMGLTIAEFQYIIDVINENVSEEKTYNHYPTKKMIDNKILSLINQGINPNYMITPIGFYMKFFEWSPFKDSNSRIRYDKGIQYYCYAGQNLRIIWSSKYIKLNKLIIGSKLNSKWYYEPDEENQNERIIVKFDLEKYELLLLETFNYVAPNPSEISVLVFTEDICKFKNP